jgi:hypothetical protein
MKCRSGTKGTSAAIGAEMLAYVFIFFLNMRNVSLFQPQYGAPPPEHRPEGPPPLSEAEFEEIMGRNRTVSSSAIARAVSDAAAGTYAS